MTVNAGEPSVTILVAIKDDSSTEGDGTVILTLSGGAGYTLGSATIHTLTITDDDSDPQPSVTFITSSSSAAEDAGAYDAHVDIGQPTPSSGLSPSYSVSGNDFTIQNSGTLLVSAGASSATIPVVIRDDSSAETVILTTLDDDNVSGATPMVSVCYGITRCRDNEETDEGREGGQLYPGVYVDGTFSQELPRTIEYIGGTVTPGKDLQIANLPANPGETFNLTAEASKSGSGAFLVRMSGVRWIEDGQREGEDTIVFRC